MAQGRFAMAVHALVLLADAPDGACSAWLASSVNTNPAFLRKVLSRLRDAGIVEAREGRDGGYLLAKPADRISLGEVYRATVDELSLRPNPAEINPACPVSAAMAPVFHEIAVEAEAAMLARLDRESIADVARRVAHAA